MAGKSKRPPPTPAHHALAAKIARTLFTGESGRRVKLLRMYSDESLYSQFGRGWSEAEAADQIARVVAGEGTA